jgi:spermidine/putrescine-binding protein
MTSPPDNPRPARTKSLAAAALLLVALAVAVAGCGGGGDASTGASVVSVSAAEVRDAQGTLSVAGWQYYQEPKAQDSAGVSAKWSYLASAPTMITKARTGEFDVVSAEADVMPALKALGVLTPIDASLLANYRRVDPVVRSSSAWTDEGQTVAVPFSVTPTMTAFDSSKVQEPKTLDDLLKPEFKDGIALYDDPTVIGGVAAAQGVEDTTRMTHEQLEEAIGFLEGLRPNIKTFFQFGEEVPLYERGDIVASIDSFGSVLAKAIEANPAIRFNFLAEGSYLNGWVIPQNADLPAALRWIDGTLSVPGQEAIVATSGDVPAVPAARKALKSLGDPVSTALSDMTVKQLLAEAPPVLGFAAEAEGDVVTIDEVSRAWDEYKASF